MAIEVHVRPLPAGGGWGVHIGELAQAASEHPTANEAERAALRLLAETASVEVVVHDRYHRRRTFTQHSRGRASLN